MTYVEQLIQQHKARRNRLNLAPRARMFTNVRQPRLKFIDPEIVFVRTATKVICSHFGYSQSIVFTSRGRHIVQIKFMIFYICYYVRSIPASKISKFVYNRNYKNSSCNIVYGSNKIKEKVGIDLNCAKQIQQIRLKLAL